MKDGFGIAMKDVGTQVGPKAFSSHRQLIDTLMHEELHHRWWKRGLYNHHANPVLDELFEATVQRYMKLKGF